MDEKILGLLTEINRKQDATDKILIEIKDKQISTDKVLIEIKDKQISTDKVLIEINRKQDSAEEILIELKESQTKLQDDIKTLTIKFDKTDEKINNISDETAGLIEFRESITLKIDNLQTNAKFQTHKLHQIEEVVFGIKNHLQIIK
ncbi:hypothetical protein [Clostridium gasigenes]|uniref:hypothetical protein n=1 Tax=Clostridium gasigenes TaxID=94869 RepID=UPI001C0E28D4|nr:hypothetical protein [Clostridium gasigenes]MBU3107719.1 hypothetical protein [Clostridium gasigenes]